MKSIFELFDRIVNGDLRPHLICNDNIETLKKLLRIKLKFDGEKFIGIDNEYLELYIKNGDYAVIDINEDEPDKSTIELKVDDRIQQLININIPPPPDDISERYLTLIEFEFEVVKHKVNAIINDAQSIKDIELESLKHIHKLKKLSKSLRHYIKTLKGEHDKLFMDEKEHYICYVLKQYLIYCIQHIQEMCSVFIDIKIEEDVELKIQLFGDFWLAEIPPSESEILTHTPKANHLSRIEFDRELRKIPDTLITYYKNRVAFIYTHIEDINFCNLPIPECIDNIITKEREAGISFSFIHYKDGFVEGYKSDYPKQAINSVEATLETTLSRLMKNDYDIVRQFEKSKPYYHRDDLHKLGYKVGQCYKQWSELFEDINLQTSLDDYIKRNIKPTTMPLVFDTIRAKTILNKACEAGFCKPEAKGYKWNNDKQLLAYFAEKMSLYLELGKGKLDGNGNQTISWKPFNILFSIQRIESAKSSYMKNNTKFEPPNFESIDMLFK